MPEVKSDLMEPACFRSALNEAVSCSLVRAYGMRQFDPGKGSIVRLRFLGGRVVRRGQGLFHHALVFGPPTDHGPIHFGGTSMDKFKFQGIQGVARKCKEDNAAGGFVQSVNGLQPSVLGPCFVHKVAQVVRFVKIDVRPVHQQSVGFGSRQNAVIFEDDLEVRFCTWRRGRREVRFGRRGLQIR